MHAAVPLPPDQVAYSGVLVDGGGVPLAGPVDLTARIYDTASAGTLVYKQSFTGVALSDGHFTLHLGPTGAATDSPTDPLTTSLRTALTGDLAAAAGRFVEISVNTNPPLARVQLVLVPYAMRADHATTADVATNALDTQAVGGLDSVAVQRMFHYLDVDGGNPPSDDPSEGVADTDGDGLYNFEDPDNDDDAITDQAELGNGTDINLATPTIAAVTPNSGEGDEVTPVSVTGTGFVSGLTAQFGSQVVSVMNVTSTSFEAGVGPQAGPYPVSVDLTVTNANGQFDALGAAFTFVAPGGIAPIPLPFTLAPASKPVGIVAQGDELLVFGSQGGAQNRGAVDTIIDGTIAFDRNVLLNNSIGVSAISWNASRVLYALRGHGASDQVQLMRDNDGDQFFATAEATVIESPGANPQTRSPALLFDASGRPGGGYLRLLGSGSTAMAFHDRDGNGSFGGVNEVVTIEAVGGSTDHLGDAVFDPSGRLAYVYYDSGNALVRVAHDRSADGDFDDSPSGVPELATAASIATPACLDASFDGSGRLGVLYVLGGNPTLLYDRNGDADFADANETQALPGSGTSTGCDLGTSALTGRLVIVHNPGNELRLLVDMNDDGDFADGVEEAALGSPITAPLGVTTIPSGAVRVLAPQGVAIGPVR
jgi:hypothetical protein